MALVLVSLGLLAALIVVAGTMDLRARKHRGRLRIDGDAAVSHRRDNDARASLYGSHRPEGGHSTGGGGF